MSDLFNWEGVNDNVTAGGKKYIYPGVYHNVVIKSIKADKNQNGTPFIRITVYTKDGGADAAKSFDLYTSEKALEYTQRNLLHIAKCIVKEEDFKKAKSVEEINDLLAGESLRMKFDGEEYEYQGEVKEKAVIGFLPFAEAIQEGAEHEPVADEDTKLVYDPKKNLKKLEKEDEATDAPESESEAAGGTAWEV